MRAFNTKAPDLLPYFKAVEQRYRDATAWMEAAVGDYWAATARSQIVVAIDKASIQANGARLRSKGRCGAARCRNRAGLLLGCDGGPASRWCSAQWRARRPVRFLPRILRGSRIVQGECRHRARRSLPSSGCVGVSGRTRCNKQRRRLNRCRCCEGGYRRGLRYFSVWTSALGYSCVSPHPGHVASNGSGSWSKGRTVPTRPWYTGKLMLQSALWHSSICTGTPRLIASLHWVLGGAGPFLCKSVAPQVVTCRQVGRSSEQGRLAHEPARPSSRPALHRR